MLTVPRVAVVALALLGAVLPGAAEAQTPAVVSPEVVHTGTAPTGYEVTFRIHDPSALRMRIKGEWSFSAASDSSASPPVSAGRLPSQWRARRLPDRVPERHRRQLAGGGHGQGRGDGRVVVHDAAAVGDVHVPVLQGLRRGAARAERLRAGVRSGEPAVEHARLDRAHQPGLRAVRSGLRDDRLFVAGAGAGRAAGHAGGRHVSVAALDEPRRDARSRASTCRPGYDPDRAQPYPLLVISHGGGGHEIDWSTQGVSSRIVDNLIASGQMQPAVVVATNLQRARGRSRAMPPTCGPR